MMVTLTCEVCAAPFQRPRHKKDRAKTCSVKCQLVRARRLQWAAYYTTKFADRFWARVDKSAGPDACWPWLGRTVLGYGMLNVRKRQKRASHISYMLARGDFDHSLSICHSCDNPICVNPAHLWPGTNQENVNDRQSKNRQARGATHGRTKVRRATQEKHDGP